MLTTIQERLKKIESQYNVQILYAVESGSRAWGFSSENSDYDVRFIYVHKMPYYLSVQDRRDVIEIMEGDLDFSGWELRKALKLMAKSNPPLLEWLRSPIVYQADPDFTYEFRQLAENHINLRNIIYHYLHMAKGNYNQYIKGRDKVRLKKYLYVLRPLLACEWVKDKQSMPPMEMDATLGLIERLEAHPEIRRLVERKRAGEELSEGDANPVLNDYIETALFYFELYAKDIKGTEPDFDSLNKFLLKCVVNHNYV